MQICFSYLFFLFPLGPLQLSGPMLLVPSWLWEPSLVRHLKYCYFINKNLFWLKTLLTKWLLLYSVGLISALCPGALSTPMVLPQMGQTFQHPVGTPFGHCLVFPGIVSFGTPCMGWTWDQLDTAMATASWTSLSSQLWGLTEKGAYKNKKTN